MSVPADPGGPIFWYFVDSQNLKKLILAFKSKFSSFRSKSAR